VFFLQCSGCGTTVPHDTAGLGHYLDNPANGLVLQQAQAPWSLTLRYLPEAYLQATQGGPPTTVTYTASTTATFKLRLKSQNPGVSVPALLAEAGSPLSLEQQQSTLFYHMQEAGYLQLDQTRLQPLAAYVEITPQGEQYVDLVFTFPVTTTQLQQASELTFVLDKAFFLTQPVRFSFAVADLLAVAS